MQSPYITEETDVLRTGRHFIILSGEYRRRRICKGLPVRTADAVVRYAADKDGFVRQNIIKEVAEVRLR